MLSALRERLGTALVETAAFFESTVVSASMLRRRVVTVEVERGPWILPRFQKMFVERIFDDELRYGGRLALPWCLFTTCPRTPIRTLISCCF
jgi:hypothetical protein